MEEKLSRFNETVIGGSYRITAVDLRVLQLLQEYRYLPSNYIGALLGLSGKYYQDILYKLRRRAGMIECPNSSWAAANARYRPAVYALTKKGEQELKERGLFYPRPKTGREFYHELGVCLIRASFALGAKQHKLDVISASDILQHPSCPAPTRHLKEPWSIPVTFDWTFQGKKTRVEQNVETDGEFFVLAKPAKGGRTTLAIPGFEFDRRTEPLEPESYERPSIRKKLIAFREIAGRGLYQSRYGLPNAIIPFITINEYHMRSMMRVVESVSNGKGSKLFIFKTLPNFAAFENFPPPDGHMLTTDWERVGHPPYNILEKLEAN